MYAYRTPGVYFEWQDIGVSPAAIQRTDCAGFVGIAARGPLHNAIKVESWSQFTSVFGEHIEQGYLAYAVEGFFENGGRKCWIVRVANPGWAWPASLTLVDDEGHATLQLLASSPGVWAHQLIVLVLRTSLERFTLLLRLASSGQEVWPNLSMEPTDPRYVSDVINHPDSGSQWVVAQDLGSTTPFPANTPNVPDKTNTLSATGALTKTVRTPNKAVNPSARSARLANGADGLATLEPKHLSGEGTPAEHCWGLACLEAIDEVAIVAMPDIMHKPRTTFDYKQPPIDCTELEPDWDQKDQANLVEIVEPDITLRAPVDREYPPKYEAPEIEHMQAALVRQCEKLKDRVAILDTLFDHQRSPEDAIAWRKEFSTSYASLYFPWIQVPNRSNVDGLLRSVPPSGHVAGVYARGDLQVGVHKPPANQVITNAKDVIPNINDNLHGRLNDWHVNVIRNLSGRGVRVSGARTLSRDLELRYINVRRLLAMIGESIDERAQDLVFEPNNPRLWRQIERVIGAFLDQLWRAGMLDGATAEEAYSVRCNAETNPPQEQELGRVISEIGVLPPWPAEFVIVRIGFSESGVEIMDRGT